MSRAVPAVSRALDILELFRAEEELSAPQIVTRLGLPRTTVHELLNTLADRGYLNRLGDEGTRYRLGVRLFELGGAYESRLDLAREGTVAAAVVSARSQETVHVAVRDGDEVLYVAKTDSTHSVRMVSAVGRRLPAHCTAVGKMLLSSLSRTEFDVLYPPGRQLAKMTARSLGTPAELWQALDRVRTDELAHEFCESNDAVSCVAAPVHDRTGAMVAALSLSVPVHRWTSVPGSQWDEWAREGAAHLSLSLGAPAKPAR
ncbi:IclR family transcriptional regulator [Saccharothrix sp. AJ9571]|nr:IclR family transcriptional regulator [Saccharothrix sp. AJ9571]